MNKQFTPGPWESWNIMNDPIRALIGREECLVAETYNVHSFGTSEANARLIAAAPEMFELLEEIAYYGVIRIEEIKQLLTKITTP